MRILNPCEIIHTTGAAGDTVPLGVIGGTILGGIAGAFFNGALHEIVLSNYQTTCEQVGGVDCFLKAVIYACDNVAPRFVPHVVGFAVVGLAIGTAYALSKQTR